MGLRSEQTLTHIEPGRGWSYKISDDNGHFRVVVTFDDEPRPVIPYLPAYHPDEQMLKCSEIEKQRRLQLYGAERVSPIPAGWEIACCPCGTKTPETFTIDVYGYRQYEA